MEFRVLGPLEVIDRTGRSVPVNGPRLRRLLAVLVLRANEDVSIDQLSDALWGDHPPASTTNAIQAQVSKLRRALSSDDDKPLIVTTGAGYRLEVPAGHSDASQFEELLAQGRDLAGRDQLAEASTVLASALDLWRGEVLADFAFDDFAQPARLRLGQERLACQEERIDLDLALGRHSQLVPELEGLTAEHPLREHLSGQLMTALYRAGRQADALRVFQRTRDTLVDELGIDPGPALKELERRVLEQDPTLLAPSPPSPTSGSGPVSGSGLPSALSDCIGRTSDMEVVRAELARRRLVTVTGPGGVGKTRLAIEVASAPDQSWAGGVWMVELDAEEGSSAIDDALARTFNWLGPGPSGRPLPGSTVDQAAAAIGSSELLLVFDNCEHVIDQAASAVTSLLRACPGLKILATSREPLDAPGEAVHQLQPLAQPDAVELFVARAIEASTRFKPDAVTLEAIAQICAGLDGLPLAIELAAARTRAFTVHQLADRIHRHFGVQAARGSERPARHHTLRAAVAWSYDLLFDDEQLLLARLSVFAGGFTLEAAETVCADTRLPGTDVAEILARLVDKSLVIHNPSSRAPQRSRYRLLAAVAEFAAEQLDGQGQAAIMRDRHLRWLAELTAGARTGLRGPDQQHWLAVLGDEEPNLGRAARWSFAGGDPNLALQITANLAWYVFITARLTDYYDMGQRVLAAAPDGPPEAQARVKAYSGLFGLGREQAGGTLGGPHGGPGLAGQAIEQARALGDQQLVGELAVLAAMPLALAPGGGRAAAALISEARAAASASGDSWLASFVAGVDGVRQMVAGDPAGGAIALGQASAQLRQLGDRLTAAQIDNRRSEAAELAGDITGAIEAVEAVLAEATEQRSPIALVAAARRAWFEVRQGELQTALAAALASETLDNQPFHQLVQAAWALVAGAAYGRGGQLDDGRRHLERAIAIYDHNGFRRESAIAHSELGRAEIIAGQLTQGVATHRTALARAIDCKLPAVLVFCLDGLARGLCSAGDPHTAAYALGASEALAKQTNVGITAAEQADRSETRAEVNRAIGTEAQIDAASAGAELQPDHLRALTGRLDPGA